MNPSLSHTPVVLLVQPDRDDRAMYAEYLRNKKFAVVCPKDGASALAAAAAADVVVTALRLPGPVDGIELIRRLRSDAHAIPIIVLTACAWDADRDRAITAGCNAFLAKPCLPSTLLAEIRRVVMLGRIPKPRPAHIANHPRRPRRSHRK